MTSKINILSITVIGYMICLFHAVKSERVCSQTDSRYILENYFKLKDSPRPYPSHSSITFKNEEERERRGIFDFPFNSLGPLLSPYLRFGPPPTVETGRQKNCMTRNEIAQHYLAYMTYGPNPQAFVPHELKFDIEPSVQAQKKHLNKRQALSERSFCHWTYVNNTDRMRWPSVIPEVKCGKLSGSECESYPRIGVTIGKTECQVVYWKMRVLRLVSSPSCQSGGYYHVKPSVEPIKVACVCVGRRMVGTGADDKVVVKDPKIIWEDDIPLTRPR